MRQLIVLIFTGLYGGGKNGYMGVGMAWPTKLYEAEAIDIHRVSDDLMDLPRKSRPGPIGRILEKGLNLAAKIGLLNRWVPYRPNQEFSERRGTDR